jgi:hypothetical protein
LAAIKWEVYQILLYKEAIIMLNMIEYFEIQNRQGLGFRFRVSNQKLLSYGFGDIDDYPMCFERISEDFFAYEAR